MPARAENSAARQQAQSWPPQNSSTSMPGTLAVRQMRCALERADVDANRIPRSFRQGARQVEAPQGRGLGNDVANLPFGQSSRPQGAQPAQALPGRPGALAVVCHVVAAAKLGKQPIEDGINLAAGNAEAFPPVALAAGVEHRHVERGNGPGGDCGVEKPREFDVSRPRAAVEKQEQRCGAVEIGNVGLGNIDPCSLATVGDLFDAASQRKLAALLCAAAAWRTQVSGPGAFSLTGGFASGAAPCVRAIGLVPDVAAPELRRSLRTGGQRELARRRSHGLGRTSIQARRFERGHAHRPVSASRSPGGIARIRRACRNPV